MEFAASLHDELGGGGGRGSAHVGDEIGDGEIGFVADTGDYGYFRSEDGGGDFFFIESPEIFERATAAGEDQNVDHAPAIEELHGTHDFRGCALALHAHGIDGEMHMPKAPAQDAHHVADGGAAWVRDQPDAARLKRQPLLPLAGLDTFRSRPLPALLS